MTSMQNCTVKTTLHSIELCMTFLMAEQKQQQKEVLQRTCRLCCCQALVHVRANPKILFVETLVLGYTNQTYMKVIPNEGRLNKRKTLTQGSAEYIPTYCTLESEK